MASLRAFCGSVGLIATLSVLSACGFLPTPEPLPTLFVLDSAAEMSTLPPSWTPPPEPVAQTTSIPEGQATPQATSVGYSPVTTTSLDNGWMLYEVAFGNYAITLPQDWVYVDIRPEMWAESSDVLYEIVPEGAVYVEERLPAYFSYGVDFIAYIETAQSGSRDFYSHVTLFSEFSGQGISLGDLAGPELDTLEVLFGTDRFTHEPVSLPGGQAERMEYTLDLAPFTGENVTIGSIAYILVEGNYTYIIELTTTASQLDSYRPTFVQVAESFQLLK